MKKNFIILAIFCICFNQEIITEFLVVEQDTIDVFSYQIPNGYDDEISHPLLIAFHQWGGNENSNYYTQFDEEANERGWLFMSPYGGAANNYNNQGAQSFVENELIWFLEHPYIFTSGTSFKKEDILDNSIKVIKLWGFRFREWSK